MQLDPADTLGVNISAISVPFKTLGFRVRSLGLEKHMHACCGLALKVSCMVYEGLGFRV